GLLGGPGSVGGGAAVCAENGAVHRAGVVGGRVEKHRCHVLGFAGGADTAVAHEQVGVEPFGEAGALGHVGVGHGARGYGVDAHRRVHEFHGHGAGHHVDGGLGHAVGDDIGGTLQGGLGGAVDDIAVAGDEVGHGRLGQPEGRRQVDGHQAVPVVLGDVRQVVHAHDAGDVAQHVELAEVGDGGVDHPVAGGAAVEVDRDGRYPGAEALGLPAGVVEGGGVDVDEAQARALAGKAEGGGATEAVGGAGDQGDLVGKTL